ncbi:MAG: phosphotransferase enzyme family protein [Bacillota bacterium]
MHSEATKKLVDQDFLNRVAELFSIDAASIQFVGGFENVVYEGLRHKQPVIIRIVHNKHRSADLIKSELHWLQYLQDNGASVCGPLPSVEGNLVESLVVQGTPLHISVFTKAPGARINISQERKNAELFQAWGWATGQLHRLTRSYRPPAEIIPRGDAVENFRARLEPFIPENPELRVKASAVVTAVAQLPKTEDWYGLIHSDIHSANFHYDAGRLYIFDFDDCSRHQLASDIAIPLYYSAWSNDLETQEAIDEFGQFFARHFLHGYLKQHTVTQEQIQTIPLLLQFRDCELLGALREQFGEQLTERRAALLKTFETRLLEGKPSVNVDWTRALEEAQ